MTIKTISRGALAFVATSLALPAFAQEDVSIFEEILVTATKREQTLQEVPVAVSVVSADTMKDSQVLDIKDLQFLVPSLRISQLQTSGNVNFIIRGFGNGANNAGIEPSVGVFIDGVYRSRSAAALSDFPNLERIEVLRGPQSTLFGKNASAGVINVVTAKPNLDNYEGSVSATYGDYSQIILKGDITGPLSDTTAFSLSGSINQRDGYFTNLDNGSEINELDRQGVRGQLLWEPSDTFSMRLIGDWDKFEEQCCGVANLVLGPTGVAIALVGGQVVPNAPFAYENFYDFDPINEVENSGFSAQFDWDMSDAVTLTSITSLRNQERFDNADVDFTSARLISDVSGNLTDTSIDTLTQEFRLAGSTDMMDWMLGAFYFDEEIETQSGLIYGDAFRGYVDILTKTLAGTYTPIEIANPAVPSPIGLIEGGLGLPPGTFFAPGQGNTEFSGMDNTATSLFAQFDFNLGERTTLTLGANYTQDEKDAFVAIDGTDAFSALSLEQVGFGFIFQGLTGLPPTQPNIDANPGAAGTAQALSTVECSATSPPPACNSLLALRPVQFLPPFVDFPNTVEAGNTDDSDTTWTVRLAYDLTDATNIYIGAGTGFKASSWNLSRDSKPFAADIPALETAGLTVNNLVPGTRFADPEESTVYEIGLKTGWDTGRLNIALFSQEIEGFQSNIFTGTGFDLANAGKQSTDGLELDLVWYPTESFQFTFAGTWLDPLYDSFEGAQGPNGPTDLSGTKPPGISELSFTTTGQYTFDIGSASAFVRAEYIFEDEVQVIENVPADIASREVSTWNASVGMRWDNGFEAMLWGRNLTDDEYLQSAFPSVAQAGSYSGYPNQPRTWGVTLRMYFD